MSTRSAPNVPVLMYHHVTPAGGMIAATPDVFEDQIARLARAGYQSLSADQFAACLAGAPVPERSVLITFDDGYLNNWVHAHPVLARHGMRAVLFIITGWIGDGPVRPHAGRAAAARHAGPRRLQAAGRRRPRRRGHAALERDRGHARRRHVRIPFPYPHAHALGQGMRRRRPGQARPHRRRAAAVARGAGRPPGQRQRPPVLAAGLFRRRLRGGGARGRLPAPVHYRPFRPEHARRGSRAHLPLRGAQSRRLLAQPAHLAVARPVLGSALPRLESLEKRLRNRG